MSFPPIYKSDHSSSRSVATRNELYTVLSIKSSPPCTRHFTSLHSLLVVACEQIIRPNPSSSRLTHDSRPWPIIVIFPVYVCLSGCCCTLSLSISLCLSGGSGWTWWLRWWCRCGLLAGQTMCMHYAHKMSLAFLINRWFINIKRHIHRNIVRRRMNDSSEFIILLNGGGDDASKLD